MVGSAAALGLAQLGYQVVLLEAFPAAEFAPEQKPDLRMSALAHASVQLLDDLGAWEAIQALRVQPYTHLSVWEADWSETTFSATEVGHEILGYFAENRITQLGLAATIAKQPNITVLNTQAVRVNSVAGKVWCADGQVIQADWIIAADGAQSQVRQQSGIATVGWQYDQQAMGITVKNYYRDDVYAERAQATTWQQFLPSGPVAFLPMHDQHASLIWYDDPQVLMELKTLDDAALKARIKAHFPAVVGEFSIIDKAVFPIHRMHAQQYIKDKVILIGDAAHAINPLAGQGVNLGFADVACLLKALANEQSLHRHYELPRRIANGQMMTAMDGFYHLFSNHNPVLKPLRNIGLFLAQRGGWAKKHVIKKAMGL
jgi:2-octaprenyl-3-methyl-6-methoxy-1,4-benzoquinol hydroxylase